MKSASSNQLNRGPYIDVQNNVSTSTPIKSTYLIKVTACDNTKKHVADGLSLFCERYIVAMAEQGPVDNNTLEESNTLFDLSDSALTNEEEEEIIMKSIGNVIADFSNGLVNIQKNSNNKLNTICYIFAGNLSYKKIKIG